MSERPHAHLSREQLDHLQVLHTVRPDLLSAHHIDIIASDQRDRLAHACRELNKSPEECAQFRNGTPCADCRHGAHVPHLMDQTVQKMRQN